MHRFPDLPGRVAIPVEHFNTAAAEDVHRILLTCLRSPRWAGRIADHRPYPDLDALLAAADEATYDLAWPDLTQALAAESLPPLPKGTYSAAHTALSAAHAAYEAKFGHAFVICLNGVAQGEVLNRILEGIRSRLTNDPEEERLVAADELRRLAKERVASCLRGAAL